MTDMAKMLRALKVLKGPFPEFDIDKAPDDPIALFSQWLDLAVAQGVSEPHAMTLSTADADGFPDARVLILKDVDNNEFHFAINSASRKGRQLAARPQAALTFHWKEQGRQVRIRGTVVDQGDADSARDYLARPESSRAAAAIGKQSQVLSDLADLSRALDVARQQIKDDPKFLTPLWRLNAVRPNEIEFWQGTETRLHKRLSYRRVKNGFEKQRLWP